MTSKIKSDFIKIMIERGFIHQTTDQNELDNQCHNRSMTGYIGFDCTASSLHVGSLIQIMMLRWFQKTGHKPIVLMGGGTTKIGDPSGKDSARPVLTNQIQSELHSQHATWVRIPKEL
jgi:tyrosyl-tRNA synthetase